MVINQSLVARTFGTYTLQLFDVGKNSWLVPALGVSLLTFAFIVNVSGNRFIGTFSMVMAILKIGGLALFAIVGLWVAEFSFDDLTATNDTAGGGFIASIVLGILAYKGFTTITNSGGEVKDPHRNVSRAIIISILICVVLYFFMAWAVASVYAVSRMLAMLTDMKLVPHSHFGMPGRVQKHTLVYTIVIAMALTIFFDLSRIASLGAIFYIVMDLAVHWGVLRHLRKDVGARAAILIAAIVFDVVVLGAFLWVKVGSDPIVIYVSLVGMALIFGGERLFLRKRDKAD